MRVLETQANAYSILCLGKIALQAAVLRVNYSVLPSGANVGEPSFAGPENYTWRKKLGCYCRTVGRGALLVRHRRTIPHLQGLNQK
jgi:hypothetical protein